MFRPGHFNRLTVTGVVVVLILQLTMSTLYVGSVKAEETHLYECKDMLLLFARGSGQNSLEESPRNVFTPNFEEAEKEAYSFFNWFRENLRVQYPHVSYKPVSVHDFPGKYDSIGYQAVPVGTIWGPIPTANTVNADASWFPGDYQASVEHGVLETVGYLKDQIASCPSQLIAVGGYSQGAQVMGDSLFRLTPEELKNIAGVGLFGDPKYIGSNDNPINLLDVSTSYPWRRGSATNQDRGMLEARQPYLPAQLEKRATSYCFNNDIVCAGYTGYKPGYRAAHSSYAAEPMRNTVNELMQWAAPRLATAERSRGGLGGSDPTAPTPAQLAKSRDIMFLFNDDSGDTVLQTFRYNLDPVLWPITQQYNSTQYGVKGYGEGETGGQNLPRVNNIQALIPYVGYDPAKPATSVSNIGRAINARYPFAQPQMGGGDIADPHGLAIEKSVFSGGWRPDAEKHLVLITDRPAKQSYQYNICNSTVRSWLQIPNTNGYEACFSKFGADIWPKVQHPEVCGTVHLAITQDTCTNPLKTPGYTHLNTRSLNDGIMAAQSQNIAVDIVVPYKITDPHNQFGVDTMMRDLKYLANATGGTFIYYDQRTKYDQVLLSDTLRQIFGHTPKSLTLAYKEALDGKQAFKKGNLVATTNQPVVVDVSGSNTHYDSYKWDFNDDGVWDQTTEGPVTETTFAAPQSGFVRVLGVNTDGQSAETRTAVVVTQPATQSVTPDKPVVPSIMGNTNADGTVTLAWQTDQAGDIVFVDPASSLPVATSSLNNRGLTFTPETAYTQLYAYVASDDSISDRVTVDITPYVPPVIEPDPELFTDPDPLPEEELFVIELPPTEPLVVEEPVLVTELPIIVEPEQPEVITVEVELEVVELPPEEPLVVAGSDPANELLVPVVDRERLPLIPPEPIQEAPSDPILPGPTEESGEVLGDTTGPNSNIDPTLCYKLQTCNPNSSPEVELVQAPIASATQTSTIQRAAPARTNTTPRPSSEPQVAAATDTRQPLIAQTLTATDPSPTAITAPQTQSQFNYLWLLLLAVLGVVIGYFVRRSKR